jgi:hypothetical protein
MKNIDYRVSIARIAINPGLATLQLRFCHCLGLFAIRYVALGDESDLVAVRRKYGRIEFGVRSVP